jgi:hypothetical protein
MGRWTHVQQPAGSIKNQRKEFTMPAAPFGGVDRHFLDFYRRFSHHFHTRTRNVSQRAEQYFKGLIQSRKRNMERMAEVVPDSDDQSLQHFLTHSGWDENVLLSIRLPMRRISSSAVSRIVVC